MATKDGHRDFESKANEDKMNKDKMKTQIHPITLIIHSSLKMQLCAICKTPVDVY